MSLQYFGLAWDHARAVKEQPCTSLSRKKDLGFGITFLKFPKDSERSHNPEISKDGSVGERKRNAPRNEKKKLGLEDSQCNRVFRENGVQKNRVSLQPTTCSGPEFTPERLKPRVPLLKPVSSMAWAKVAQG